MNKRYIIRLICLLLLLAGSRSMVYAQQAVTIKGRVTDATSREGIPGVTIIDIKNNKGLGVTDASGRFTITADPDKSIQFRYIGYRFETVKIGKATVLNVILSAENKSLKEAVIVGYQKRTKETVSGSVAVISGKELQDVPVSNIQELLQGKVAGLNIQNNTGAPGFRGTMSVRGVSQLNVSGSGDQAYLTSNNPLLVIDNVPVDFDGGISQSMLQPGAATGPLALIPPEDVQSIEVMKDAQATALYGSRGANGVIVVTTKKGNSPTPIIDVNSSLFINLPPKLRPTIGGNLERRYRISSILQNAMSIDDARDILSQIGSLKSTDGSQFLTDSLNPFYNNSTDWQGLFYQTTLNTNNNVQISGGNVKMNYKANFAYQMNQGVLKNTGFNKYSLNMQLNMQPTPRLRIGAQLFSALGQKQRGNGGGLTGNGAGNSFTSSLLPGPSKFIGNPQLDGYENNVDDNNTVNIRGFLDVDYELLSGLRINSTTSYDYYTDTRDRFNMSFSNNNATGLYGFVGRHDELNTRNGVNYSYSTNKRDQEKGHNIYASVFSEINLKSDDQHVRDVRNGPNDYYWGPRGYSPRFYPGNPWNNASEVNVNGTPVSYVYHAASWAGFLSYNFRTKYSIDLAYRLDGSSAAGINNPYTKNPSVGLRWNFNKENLMRQWSWLDYGSVRVTYGVNSRPSATLLNSLGVYKGTGAYNNSTSIIPEFSVLANPSMEPEKSSQFNFGVDLGLFKGRVEIIYDTYYKNNYNIVRDNFLPNSLGYDKIQVNGGAIVNYGHELALTVRPIVHVNPQAFQWTVSLNGAYNDGVLTKLPGGSQFYLNKDDAYNQGIALKVGRNPQSNYLFQTLGIYNSTADVPVDPVRGVRFKAGGGFLQAGDPIWKDLNGDYSLTDADYVIMGNPEPKLVGGFNNTFSYRNFSLSVYCSYLYDRSVLNNAIAARINRLLYPYVQYTPSSAGVQGPVNLYDISLIDYWKANGGNATHPAIVSSFYRDAMVQPNRLNQSLYMEDGSYFKINQISLAYQFRGFDFMKKLRLRLLRAYFTAYNVAMFSKYTGPNPETVTSLGRDDINGYPNARSFTIGIGAQF
ncbi:SusC/RagA family TonB-linked outer membrane protein [Chitinophaga polysaccharea]|uniref:SusC/RagA family TonB-linked outer membrane protein n=1 Tax=Chitinophaga TaxID=79328 RepID=UPI0014552FDA|nr:MULTISPECIES: SusC/RagA family TonB-linked outer membrane protein [Chitinophaga]NLR57325.1 SusC/RagA family TonB-linked outer membrane protein [Chitinophaga polysaccharea]NLU91557.1 SusC/RagA family TonB-linked outer membrane protein [Chitinophaga sp. Ak27]